MVNWEYMVDTFPYVKNHIGFAKWLNHLGGMGWELVETWKDENVGISYTKVLFKRPLKI